MVVPDGATSGWLLKRSPAFGDRWLRYWCVFKYSQEEDALALDCYADQSCRRRLYHICMGEGARVMHMKSKDAPAAFLKFKQQHPNSLIVDAGDDRLCPFYLFDAIDADSYRLWTNNVTSQMQALDAKRKRQQQEKLLNDRAKIIDSIFAALDDSMSGVIWSDDLRRYAETSGFSGSDDDWHHEFEELCEDRGWKEEKGISSSQFGKFLSSDTSVSMQELSKILECLEGLYEPPATDSWAKQSVVTNNLKLKTRADIINALFNCLKSSETGQIGCDELQRYAILSGFDGDDDDWLEEYNELCEEQGWDKDVGLAHSDFAGLLEDDTMGSDEELKAMLMELRMPKKKRGRTIDQMSHLAKKSGASRVREEISEMSRGDLVNEAFTSLDVRQQALLGSREFRRYAELTGYDGGDESWPDLYDELCEDYGWQSSEGVSREQFRAFIGDESHSPDDELQELVLELRLRQDVALRRFRSAVHRVIWLVRYNGSAPPRGRLTRQEIQQMSRKELVDAVFNALDRKQTQKLDSKGMRQFAHLTGFYGDEADWNAEFHGMCESLHWSESEGVSRSQFRDFIGDEENTSNEELQVLLFNLPQGEAVQARRSLVASRYKSFGRAEVLDELYGVLAEGDVLPIAGLKRLADLTGTTLPGLQNSKGLTKAQFVEALADESKASTEALRHALLNARGDLQLSSKPWSRRSVVQSLRGSDAAGMDRASLIQAIFTILDQAKTGALDAAQVRAYAEQTGFDGTDADWEEQFAAMCEHFGWSQSSGITRIQFNELIEDDDETDDDELRQALLHLQMQVGKSSRPSVVGSSWQRRSLLHLPNVDSTKNMSRSEMTSNLFSLLDTSGSSRLSSAQLRKFAEASGFEGDADEWASQFNSMCEHFGCNPADGVSQPEFLEFIGDEVEHSDEELRRVLVSLQAQRRQSTRHSVSSSSWGRRSFVQSLRGSDAAGMDRASLIQAIFTILDRAKTGALDAAQVRAYAEQTGFDGTDADWEEQFAAMCEHFGWSQSSGITRSQFNELIEDDDETDDDELRQALLNLQMQVGKSSRPSVVGSSWQRKSLLHLPNVDSTKNMSRSEMTSNLFSLLDTSGSSRLSSAQLRKFAEASGFEGDADEWASQFNSMCEHFGCNPADGVSQPEFLEFIGDEVEHSDEELRRVLVSLQARA